MWKNPTPQQLALYAATFLGFFVFFIVALLQALAAKHIADAAILVVLPLLTIVVAYFYVKYLIDNFIYRRIKVIYKRITEFKKGGDVEHGDMVTPQNIAEVEKRVEEWADEKNNQIKLLQDLETYRRNYIGNVSHELKTPIFNIQGFLHTLLEGGIHDEQISIPYLQKAAKNVERLQTIVEDLETISRLEAGQMPLDLQLFDLHKLTQEVFEHLELRATERNIKLQFKDGARANLNVRADREAIRQVLTNLINNSIKYGKQGGTTKVSFYDMDKKLLIEVSDNGIGIARHHLRHVFDRFYRIDKSRSRAAGGSGLGLSIVKHVIEAHKQSVHLRSAEGIGSTFGFTLEKG